MPSSYTVNTGIEKPAQGEQSGSWGTTVNTNMDIVDRAINGIVSLSLSGTASTLTTNDGNVSDGQYKVLVLSGILAAVHTITVDPSDAQKIYYVQNDTNETVTFTQGTGVANANVTSGAFSIIYADGSDEVHNLSNSLGTESLSIDGTEVTASAEELNVLDGISPTLTTAEVNVLDGLTATTAELNTLDGVNPALEAADLNFLDGAAPETVVNEKAVIYGDAGEVAAQDVVMPADGELKLGVWTIKLSGTDLKFNYDGTDVMKLSSTGALTAEDDVTAFGDA